MHDAQTATFVFLKPMIELADRELRRWHGRVVVVGILLAGSAAFGYRLPLRDRKFADSPLEGDGFEPSVPRQIRPVFETAVRTP
jgi:hypothetical protein